ncbi:MAG: HAD-IA family hydrolase [Kangiellaceae bacterium]|nr:HAD-IA family hydrolase [Kangiellaceae bacterium]
MDFSLKNTIKAVFFDLDGTLVDTAPDMAAALNIQLEAHNKATLAHSEIRPHVSHGAAALLKLGFNITLHDDNFDNLRQQYLNIYADNLAVHSRLFEGLSELLEELDRAKILWGVVTNKPEFLTIPLLQQMNLLERACAVISGDTVTPSKPNPLPLFVACQQAKVIPTQALYIGDAKRDISAGRSAGMKTVIANYGYIQENDDIKQWNGDMVVDKPTQLKQLLFG